MWHAFLQFTFMLWVYCLWKHSLISNICYSIIHKLFLYCYENTDAHCKLIYTFRCTITRCTFINTLIDMHNKIINFVYFIRLIQPTKHESPHLVTYKSDILVQNIKLYLKKMRGMMVSSSLETFHCIVQLLHYRNSVVAFGTAKFIPVTLSLAFTAPRN